MFDDLKPHIADLRKRLTISTIIGARKIEQLDDSFKAFDFKISSELLKKIEIIQKNILYPMG